ncbi:MAG: hypothetical protein JWM16_6180 [Verrucomicrobiales bacterium]|nr:hypothetical protein [Verrucomicrobiales bacterium]
MLTPEEYTALIQIRIANGSYPPQLYKYRAFDANTESIFRDHSLWFAQPATLNDPFDGQIYDKWDYSLDEIYRFLIRLGAEPEAARSLAEAYPKHPELFVSFVEEGKQTALSPMGILSLSKVPDSILAWSHYAASHSGFVLGFTIMADIPFFRPLSKVNYVDEYPSLSYLREPESLFEIGVLSKSKIWSSEQEFRATKKSSGLRPFSKLALAEVIFGAKTKDADKEKLRSFVIQYGYGHVVLKQAKVSRSKYEIEIHPA